MDDGTRGPPSVSPIPVLSGCTGQGTLVPGGGPVGPGRTGMSGVVPGLSLDDTP